MKKIVVILVLFLVVNLFGADGKALAMKLGLSASSKASAQWKRVFKKKRKMKKYGINKLNDDEKLMGKGNISVDTPDFRAQGDSLSYLVKRGRMSISGNRVRIVNKKDKSISLGKRVIFFEREKKFKIE